MNAKHQRPMDVLTREGGEGLPPGDAQRNTWLFTCCECGRRWADPPSIVSGCGCGSEQVVGHRFESEEYRQIRFEGGIKKDIPRFVRPPKGFHKNPDCDLHGSVDLLSRAPDKEYGHALIDVRRMDNGSFEVSLNAGIFGNYGPEDYDHLIVSRHRVQLAVNCLAQRSRDRPEDPDWTGESDDESMDELIGIAPPCECCRERQAAGRLNGRDLCDPCRRELADHLEAPGVVQDDSSESGGNTDR